MVYSYQHLFASISPVRDRDHKPLFWRFTVFHENSERALSIGVRPDSRSALDAATSAIDHLLKQQTSSLAA